LLTVAVVASAAYGTYALARKHRANRSRQGFQQALQRRDFVTAHSHMVNYLRLCPGDVGVHLLAAQAGRRAQFQQEFLERQTDLLHQATRHLEDCAKLKGPEESIALERALLSIQQAEFAELDETLLGYVETDNPDVPLVLEALIYGLLQRANVDKAAICISKLLLVQPDNVQALVWRGRLKEQLFSNLVSAREDFEEAVALNPDFDSARFCLVQNLLRVNRAEEASRHLAALEERVPDNPLVRLSRALCHIAQGQTEAGRALLDDWLTKTPSTHPRRLEALTARANLALTLDQPAQGKNYALQALRIAPLDRMALYILYRSLIAQGQHQEAKQVLTQLDQVQKDLEFVNKANTQIALTPNDRRLRHQLGEAYLRLGRPSDALVWFMSVLHQDPVYRPTLQALLEHYEKTGDVHQAAEFRQRLASVDKSIQE
jgi:tetratricopeptide (TPR) repeat protein